MSVTEPMTMSILREQATISVGEVAAVLGIARSTAYQMIANGDIPVIDIGKNGKRVLVQPLLRLLGDVDEG